MGTKRETPPSEPGLRAAAEQIAVGTAEAREALLPEEARQMLHELRVHRIELELQNEELRRAQMELHGTRARYFDLYHLAPVGYCTVSDEGEIQEANLAAATLLAVPTSRLIGRPLSQFIVQADQDVFYLHRRQLATGTLTDACELRMLRGGGGFVWVSVQTSAAADLVGQSGYRVVLIDITPRKAAEAALQDSEVLNLAILDAVQSEIAVIDRAGVILVVNRAWRRMAEKNGPAGGRGPAHTRVGTNYLAVCRRSVAAGDVSARAALAGIEAVIQGQVPSFLLEYVCHVGGCARWFSMVVTPMGRDGRRFVVAHSDVTAVKESEARLREQGRLLADSQAFAHIGSWMAEVATGRSTWSDEMFRLVGLPITERAPSVAELIRRLHPEDQAAATAWVTSCRLGLAPTKLAVRILGPEGDERWILIQGVLDTSTDPEKPRTIGTVQDITDQTRLAAELAQHRDHLEELVASRTAELTAARVQADAANKSKSAFLANMSHEIRTPINAIIGVSHLLRRAGVTPDQAARLQQIDAAGRHLLSIVNDVLDLSKIEAGHLVLDCSDFSLRSILDHVASIVGESARSKGLRIEVDPGDAPLWLRGDPTRLRQALLNYAGNAVKFTETGSVVLRSRLGAEQDGECVVHFEVIDTGIGIAPELVIRLFRAFEQGDQSATRRFGGTGLGLAITRQLAGLMGGEVGVESAPDAGSRFWFTARLRRGAVAVPAQPAMGDADAEAALRRDHRGARVLVVDDNAINRDVVEELLRAAGLVVRGAADGAEALRHVGTNACDLILMDRHMPTMDGLDATRAIRALPALARIPILALTASAFAEHAEACAAAGMDAVLVKPVEPALLYGAVWTWLERAAGRLGERTTLPAATPAGEGDTLGELAQLPGVDVARGLSMVRGDRLKYLALLRQFVAGHRSDPVRLAEHLSRGEHTEAWQLAHALCGAAGSVGARALATAAGVIEQRVRADPGSVTEDARSALLATLGDELTLLVGALAAAPLAPGGPPAPAPASLHAALREIDALLGAYDTAVLDLLEAHAVPLVAGLGAPGEELARRVRAFEFDRARQLIADILPPR